MPDYDFSHLETRSFQHLVQSLALRVIGPSVIVYGDGPDGGRDATVQGTASIPEAGEWAGYTVIQVKFRQKTGTPQADARWLVKELEKELKRFSNRRYKRAIPENYIIASNVSLSSSQDTGGKDLVDAKFHEYKPKLGLQKWSIWDGVQIQRLLDGTPEIRQTYAAWITPGDVLHSVLNSNTKYSPDFLNTISRFLQIELLRDQYPRLHGARGSERDHVPLSRVFIDLPAQRRPSPPTLDGVQGRFEDGLPHDQIGFLEYLTRIAADKYDPESVRCRRIGRQERSTSGRIVLVGGPGQGKTTLGQYACQLFRASLLEARRNKCTDEVLHALETILTQAQTGSTKLPTVRRFPIRVVLNEYADALAREQSTSILDYLCKHIRRRTDMPVQIEHMRNWLTAYPWLLVLDGLDEVPASSNRRSVLDSVHQFLVESTELNADVLIVATTRPQGYHSDFNPEIHEHWYLSPLPAKSAKNYAKLLIGERFKHDGTRSEVLLSRVDEALHSSQTARLMQSPLQVTILTLLSEQKGKLPQDRWSLFNEYFRIIYDREVERSLDSSSLLSDYRDLITRLHREVGFQLQRDAEVSGRTDSHMARDRFKILAVEQLRNDGFSQSEADKLAERMVDAALERLVFLVSPEGQRIGFEIRSLQEFSAGEHLADGSDANISARMEQIAEGAHWRNTLRFMIGNIVYQRKHLLDGVISLCSHQNEGDDANRRVLPGSRLAMDLLEDGFASQHPRWQHPIIRIASRVMELPPSRIHSRVSESTLKTASSVFELEIRASLEGRSWSHAPSAWLTLLQFVALKEPWAIKLGDEFWPRDDAECVDLLETMIPLATTSRWLTEKFSRHIFQCSPDEIMWRGQSSNYRYINYGDLGKQFDHRGNSNSAKDASNFLKLFGSVANHPPAEFPIHTKDWEVGFISMMISVKPVFEIDRLPSLHGSIHPEWSWCLHAANFRLNPCPETLATALVSAFENSLPHRDLQFSPLSISALGIPWPLLACIAWCITHDDAQTLAQRIRKGDLGTRKDWELAEARWIVEGVTRSEMEDLASQDLPFNGRIKEYGFPVSAVTFMPRVPDFGDSFLSAVSLLIRLSRNPTRILSQLDWLARRSEGFSASATNPIWSYIPNNPTAGAALLYLAAKQAQFSEEWIYRLEQVGNSVPYRVPSYVVGDHSDGIHLIGQAFMANAKRSGLLPWLVMLIGGAKDAPIPPQILALPHLQENISAILLRLRFCESELPGAAGEDQLSQRCDQWCRNEGGLSNHVVAMLCKDGAIGQVRLRLIETALRSLPRDSFRLRRLLTDHLAAYLDSKGSRLSDVSSAGPLGLAIR